MSDVVPFRSPRARAHESTALVGMIIFVASWAMMFAALFFAYGMVRSRAAAWPPDLLRLPLGLPALNTAILAASSLALELGLRAVQGNRARVAGALRIGAAALLGAAFLALQTVVWLSVWAGGLRADSGPYASVFYGLTWVHAAQVAIGLVALAWIALRAARGTYSPARHLTVRLWTIYWHFVGVVWALMFVAVFLV